MVFEKSWHWVALGFACLAIIVFGILFTNTIVCFKNVGCDKVVVLEDGTICQDYENIGSGLSPRYKAGLAKPLISLKLTSESCLIII